MLILDFLLEHSVESGSDDDSPNYMARGTLEILIIILIALVLIV